MARPKKSDARWTVIECAEAWGVSDRTVYRWLSTGALVEGKDYDRTPSGGAYRLKLSAMPKGWAK
jgi:hypothetical protein